MNGEQQQAPAGETPKPAEKKDAPETQEENAKAE